ncbi:C6 finger domain protein, putative [Paecilomyces variotii No. 5]|uniref:C6 finger domain protein, putative n=1 Tax=Byssochlamys spectabilis (strain No. 5 / NBRC 109023) TaxID=1356009 RepID=V5FLQ6_BYSSN|nr:C6 finger domain protein, putative [Paecilomyces variotii No. 5]
MAFSAVLSMLCDQARPTCSQCTRAGRSCPGYRDELSLLFRDESQDVVRKAKEAKPPRVAPRLSKKKRTSCSFKNDTSLDDRVILGHATNVEASQHHYDCGPLMLRWISAPLKEQATNFFFANFAWLGASLMANGTLFAPNLESSLGGKALMAGVASIGCATLSNIHNAPELNISARENYTAALRLVGRALEDPTQAKTDLTFTASILLGIFEVVTCRSATTIDNWTSHVSGAMALFQLQGAARLKDEAGMRMFHQLRNQILISCLQTKRHVPAVVLELSKKAASLKAPDATYTDQLTDIVAKLCNLRADIASKSITKNSEIFSAACSIECELSAWVNSLPSTWAYSTTQDTREYHKVKNEWNDLYPYNGRYHVYGDLWMCNAWNNYRAARILVNEIILARLRLMHSQPTAVSSSSEFGVQCANIRSTLRQLAADVCYSIPYACGNVNGSNHIDVEDVYISKSSIGGFIVLWPLFLAASVDGWDRVVGEWCIECFRWIGRTLGIGQALAMIDILRMNTGIVRWMDFMHQEIRETASGNEANDLPIDNGEPWWDWEMVKQEMQLCISR